VETLHPCFLSVYLKIKGTAVQDISQLYVQKATGIVADEVKTGTGYIWSRH
jgi:hypothetical protein